jgi:hypothetical protein
MRRLFALCSSQRLMNWRSIATPDRRDGAKKYVSALTNCQTPPFYLFEGTGINGHNRQGERACGMTQGQIEKLKEATAQACTMKTMHLRRIDPPRNRSRFDRLDMQPDLFGGVLLVKEWGRIGARGRMVASLTTTKLLPSSPCSDRPSVSGGVDTLCKGQQRCAESPCRRHGDTGRLSAAVQCFAEYDF